MYRPQILVFLLLLFVTALLGQREAIHDDLRALDKNEVFRLPALDNEALQRQYRTTEKYTANRFAEPRDVYVTPRAQGQWEYTKGGDAVWRYGVSSPGAYTINLGFTEFELTPGARLYIYNTDRSEVLGPFTDNDNDDHLQLWTPVLAGDEVILELHLPPSEIDECKLVLSRVNHDFKDIRKGLGGVSGSCNLDVTCGADDGWPIVDNYRDIISSVGAYSYNGIDQCSGVLINNARNDCTPYFLTAAHCGISNTNSSSVVVYWNYENSICRQPDSFASGQPGDGSRLQFNTGANLKASLVRSDFALIELDDPVDPNYDLYFAGWSRAYELPDTAICIHHPGVEEKRISFEFNKLDYDPTGNDTTHLLVNDWDIGTTEGGSSGSPLFNTDKKIIGQLTGGFAACGNDASDSYGWFRRSWFGDGGISNSLRFWLDPDNQGMEVLEGRSCSFSIDLESNFYTLCSAVQDSIVIPMQAGGLFDGDVTYEIIDIPLLLEGNFEFINGPHDSLNYLIVGGFSRLPGPSVALTLAVSDQNNMATVDITIEFDTGSPGVPVMKMPEDGAEDVSLNQLFTVMRGPADLTIFQIARDPDFNEIVLESDSDNHQLLVNSLEESTEYFWRARSVNLCGQSEWSEARRFKTAFVFCTQIYSGGEPVIISDGSPGTGKSEISFPYGVVTENVNIPFVRGSHDYVSDLELRVIYGTGEAILFSGVCDDENDFHLGFDDEAIKSNIACPPTDMGIYQPLTPLDVFQGSFAGGNWTLEVEDMAFLDGGQLDEWSMQLCFSKASMPVLIPENHRVVLCPGEGFLVDVYADFPGSDMYEMEVIDPLLNDVPFDIINVDTARNIMTVRFEDISENLLNSSIRLIARDENNMELAQSYIELVNGANADIPLILSPSDKDIIPEDSIFVVEWDFEYEGEFRVEIADNIQFIDPVFTANGRMRTRVEVDKPLAPGLYYIRVVLVGEICNIHSPIVEVTIDRMTSSAFQGSVYPGFEIYPNPTREILYVEIPDSIKHPQIRLLNTLGQAFSIPVQQTPSGLRLITSDLEQGIYYLLISNGDIRVTLPFVRSN